MKEKLPNFMKDDHIVYIIMFIAISIILFLNEFYVTSVCSLAAMGASIIATHNIHKNRVNEMTEYLIDYTNSIENLSVSSIFNYPMPVVIVNKAGRICWNNMRFYEAAGDSKLEKISEYAPAFSMKDLEDDEQGILNAINFSEIGKTYDVMYSELDEELFIDDAVYILYLIDTTDYNYLKTKYTDERPVVMMVQIDNYEEVSEKMDKLIKASMIAEIEKRLSKYAKDMNGLVLKYQDSKFLLMIEAKFLKKLEENKFEILEEVKEIQSTEDFFFTLSIGVGVYGKTITELYKHARGALDIALGRGGDQAVVKTKENVKFYGGNTKAVEKRTKVKARILSFALRQIIDQSSNVIIMGHRIGDMDSLGSSIGVHAMAKSRGKDAYIILNSVNFSLNNLYNRMMNEDDEYKDDVISSDQAYKLVDEDTVVIIVDTHKGSFTEDPELLSRINKKVLIDHHRRGEEYVNDAVLDYIEPYASSTCELVSEMISYMGDHIKLTKFEADALLAGMVVDTNSFTYRTGVRTFEAASYLRRQGADTIEVKELFSEELGFIQAKTDIIDRADVHYDDVAITYIEEDDENSLVLAAKVADDLLNVRGINASFILVNKGDYIHISGRSMGKISVQLILEMLGGGGHLTMAGAQIQEKSIEQTKVMLLDAIKQYKEDGSVE